MIKYVETLLHLLILRNEGLILEKKKEIMERNNVTNMTSDMSKTPKDSIKCKQYKLNNLLSKDQSSKKLISKEILKLSCELDKLIVKFYSSKKK